MIYYRISISPRAARAVQDSASRFRVVFFLLSLIILVIVIILIMIIMITL